MSLAIDVLDQPQSNLPKKIVSISHITSGLRKNTSMSYYEKYRVEASVECQSMSIVSCVLKNKHKKPKKRNSYLCICKAKSKMIKIRSKMGQNILQLFSSFLCFCNGSQQTQSYLKKDSLFLFLSVYLSSRTLSVSVSLSLSTVSVSLISLTPHLTVAPLCHPLSPCLYSIFFLYLSPHTPLI